MKKKIDGKVMSVMLHANFKTFENVLKLRKPFVLFVSGASILFLFLYLCLTLVLKLFGESKIRGVLWTVAPILAWVIAITQIFFQLFLKEIVTPR